jgi:hypothetical protein
LIWLGFRDCIGGVARLELGWVFRSYDGLYSLSREDALLMVSSVGVIVLNRLAGLLIQYRVSNQLLKARWIVSLGFKTLSTCASGIMLRHCLRLLPVAYCARSVSFEILYSS